MWVYPLNLMFLALTDVEIVGIIIISSPERAIFSPLHGACSAILKDSVSDWKKFIVRFGLSIT